MAHSKKEREEAQRSLLDSLKACGESGKATLVITELESKPSNSGRTHYLDLRVWEPGDDGAPRPAEWLTYIACKAKGWRFNPKREAISMGGYGYCRATEIASQLARLAGFPIRVESVNTFGPRGWYPKAP